VNKNIDNKNIESKNKDTASLFLVALLLICITAGLVRGIKMEPRNPKKQRQTPERIS
jgi:hypothetical protein